MEKIKANLMKYISNFCLKTALCLALFFVSVEAAFRDDTDTEYELMCKACTNVFNEPMSADAQAIFDAFKANYEAPIHRDRLKSKDNVLIGINSIDRVKLVNKVLKIKRDHAGRPTHFDKVGKKKLRDKDRYITRFTLGVGTATYESLPTSAKEPLNFVCQAGNCTVNYAWVAKYLASGTSDNIKDFIYNIALTKAGNSPSAHDDSTIKHIEYLSFLLDGEVARRMHPRDAYKDLPVGTGIVMAFKIARDQDNFLPQFFKEGSDYYIAKGENREQNLKNILHLYRMTFGTMKIRNITNRQGGLKYWEGELRNFFKGRDAVSP